MDAWSSTIWPDASRGAMERARSCQSPNSRLNPGRLSDDCTVHSRPAGRINEHDSHGNDNLDRPARFADFLLARWRVSKTCHTQHIHCPSRSMCEWVCSFLPTVTDHLTHTNVQGQP